MREENTLEQIPLSEPCLGPEEQAAVTACLSSNWISPLSPLVKEFEHTFSQRFDSHAALALNCGTAALHLALRLCGVGPGDWVAVPAMSFVATVNPVMYLGANPVFVDVNPKTFGLDPEALQRTLQKYPNIKAIMVTHLYGHPADITTLLSIAQDIPIIEDASEALGSKVNGRFLGTFGFLGCYSFNGNKTITTGSGGMLVGPQSDIINQGRYLAMQARGGHDLEFDHTDIGYNYRMNGIQAAIGLAQLDKIERLLLARQTIAKQYVNALDDAMPNVITHLKSALTLEVVPWLSTILTKNQSERDHVLTGLRKHGIEARPFFKPLPLLKPYQSIARGVFPVAQSLWERGVCLPSSPSLSVTQQTQVITRLHALLTKQSIKLTHPL